MKVGRLARRARGVSGTWMELVRMTDRTADTPERRIGEEVRYEVPGTVVSSYATATPALAGCGCVPVHGARDVSYGDPGSKTEGLHV